MKLINDDCFTTMREIEDNSLDAIVTDPPYATNQLGSFYASKTTKPTFIDFINGAEFYRQFLNLSKKILKEDTYIIMFANWRTAFLVQKACFDEGLKLVSQIVWNKKTKGLSSNIAVRPSYELVLVIAKGSPAIKNRSFTDIYELSWHKAYYETKHPVEKPVKLLKDLIKLILPEGGTVCDPFMGSGSTGKACQNLKESYNFIGIEAEKKYFDMAKNRLKNEVKIN